MSCVALDTRAVPSSRSSTFAMNAKRSAIHEHAAIPHPSVNPSRFIEPTRGLRFSQPNFCAPVDRHSFRCREENGIFNPSSIFGSLTSRSWTGSILSFSANSCIAAWGSHVTGRQRGSYTQIGDSIHQRRGLAPLFLVVVQDRRMVHPILAQGSQFSVARGAQPNALRNARSMPHGLKHHPPADHQLHRLCALLGGCPRGRRLGPGKQLAPEARAQEL